MHDASRRVLYLLETVEVPLRNAVQEAVAVIDPGMAVAIDFADSKVSDGRRCHNRPKVEITRTDDVGNVLIK